MRLWLTTLNSIYLGIHRACYLSSILEEQEERWEELNQRHRLSGLLKIADDQDQARRLPNSFQFQLWNFLVVQLCCKLHRTLHSLPPLEGAVPLSLGLPPPGPITENRSSLKTKGGNSAGSGGRGRGVPASQSESPRRLVTHVQSSADQWQGRREEGCSHCVTAVWTNGHVARGL